MAAGVPGSAKLDKNGQPKRKRNRRRKRRMSLSSESSSSSSSEEESDATAAVNAKIQTVSVNGETPKTEKTSNASAEEDEDSDSSSSSGSSSDSEIDYESAKPDPIDLNALASAPTHLPALTSFDRPELTNRQRSPSPPYFGFPDFSGSSSKKRSKPILWGELPGDHYAQPTAEMEKEWQLEQEMLKRHYLEVVVNRFGKELDDMRKEPGVADRLGVLTAALGQGASLMETAQIAKDMQDKDRSIWSAVSSSSSKQVPDSQIGIEALKQQAPSTSITQQDVDME